MTPAVFLDRDGTMIHDVHYLRTIDQIAFFPWTIDAIRALNEAGLPVVVVTNQSAIARGLLTEPDLHEIHAAMDQALQAGRARVAAYYYCPHHVAGKVASYAIACECRKPGRALVDRAARELHLDPRRSVVVGDNWRDVGLARAVGAKGVLVRTGGGRFAEANPKDGLGADAIVDNLAAAASWILQR